MAFDKSLLREYMLPTIFCPGCGHGVVTQAFIRAAAAEGWERDDVIVVSGIGCSARIPAYPDFNGIQTTHGRALAYATGIKMAKPDKHVVLFLGDGDCTAIGGNHFLHACRRNMDLTVVVVNNYIYGMTGGQASPTTPHGSISTTTQYGNIDNQLDVCKLAVAAGATFVARSTAYHAQQIEGLMHKAFTNKGLSVLEVMCPCPTGYGRRNKYKNVIAMYDYLKDAAVPKDKFDQLSAEEQEKKISIGVFADAPKPEYIDKYDAMVAGVKTSKEREGLVCRQVNDSKIDRYECRFAGSGGQGLILAGIILSEAMIRQNKYAVHTQSYGPEARGGSSKSEVVIGDAEISYPEVSKPDIFVAMMPDAYEKYAEEVPDGGVILVDSTYVQAKEQAGVKTLSYPISQVCADELGDIRAANIMLLGILAGLLDFVDYETLKEAILSRLAPKLHELNLKAVQKGYEQGLSMKKSL